MLKKTVSCLLALAVMVCSVSALAETVKHERVFVVTGADGAVQSLTDSIRLENADQLDEIRDRTLLTGIENVGGSEPFTLDGETLIWQAGGKDITYQGTSDKTPALLPAVTLTLDGADISAADLKEKTGEAKLTVTWPSAEPVPALAVTLLLLPEEGVTGLQLENAAVLTVLGRQVLVGWAVPGMDASLGLPVSFSASFHADHVNLGWAMTLVTSEPLEAAIQELDTRLALDPEAELKDLEAVLTALKDGTDLPETAGFTKDIVPQVRKLNAGLNTLNNGASTLVESAGTLTSGASSVSTGAAQVKDGAAALSTGLSDLNENSGALNTGASQLFRTLLDSAGQQLAASGLEAAGITVPALTPENYAEVLDGVMAKLPAGMSSAANQLAALKAQLDQVNTFVTGLQTYTDGVAQAAESAETLSEGAVTLSDGAAKLSGGALALQFGLGALQTTGTQVLRDSILDAEKSAAEKILPLLQGDVAKALRLCAETRENLKGAGYDLRPEEMKTVTVCIIRTDLQ